MLYESSVVEQFAKELAKDSNFQDNKMIYLEKDIWLTFILKYLYDISEATKELVFKGGTSLVKCHYSYYRFSEDLDFTWVGEKTSKKLNRKNFKTRYINKMISDFGLGFEETSEIKGGVRHSQSGKILNYFFILPTDNKEQKLKINVSFDELVKFPINQVALKPMQVTDERKKELIGYFGKVAQDYFDPTFVSTYSKEEIACEKIRALMTRKEKINRSRDIVDLFHLSKDVNLMKLISCKDCQDKIKKALQTPSYGDVFKERILDIDQYLDNMIEYTKQEPVYVTDIDYDQLNKFAIEEIKPILMKFSSSL